MLNVNKREITVWIGYGLFVAAIFAVLVIYLAWAQGQNPIYRDAGLTILGGFIGGAVYSGWEKVVSRLM